MPPNNAGRTRARRIGVTLTAVMVVILGAAIPAHAAPSISDLEKQIAAADNTLEPIVEEYDHVDAMLQANQSQADKLEVKLRPLQLQAVLALSELAPLAAQVYEQGPGSTMNLMLGADSTTTLLDRLGYVDQMARMKQQQISAVVLQRDKYSAAKKKLDDLRAGLARQVSELSAKKKVIETQVSALQTLRQKTYGTTGAIGALRPVACPFIYSTGPGGVAARKACSAIGSPYIWATSGPKTFDCSGLTLWAWAAAGVTLRHYTVWQYQDNKPVSRANLQPGDLVFFFPPSLHHMGIYVGGGWMVHAPTTGDYVRMAKIDKYPIAGFRRPS
jgi:cell wall-associated NlpC family hydrolase